MERQAKAAALKTSYAPEHFKSVSMKDYEDYSLEFDGWPLDRPGFPAYNYNDHLNKHWKWHLWTCGKHICHASKRYGELANPKTENEREFKPKKRYDDV